MNCYPPNSTPFNSRLTLAYAPARPRRRALGYTCACRWVRQRYCCRGAKNGLYWPRNARHSSDFRPIFCVTFMFPAAVLVPTTPDILLHHSRIYSPLSCSPTYFAPLILAVYRYPVFALLSVFSDVYRFFEFIGHKLFQILLDKNQILFNFAVSLNS